MAEHPPQSLSDALRRIDREAAEWLVKRDRGLTPAEQDAYFQWMAADSRHGERLAWHRRTWSELDALAQWRPEHSPEPNPDLLACLAASTAGASTTNRGWWRWRRLAPLLALAAAVAILLVWRSTVAPIPVVSPVAQTTKALEVAVGYERRVLNDGSVVELNRGASLSVEYTPGERRVWLHAGEALFTVSPDPARPFIVRAAGVGVRAVGTAFNVRLGDNALDVLVTHGRVRVLGLEAGSGPSADHAGAPATPPELGAGQRMLVSLGSTRAPAVIESLGDAEIARELAWKPQLLEFDSVPLGEVVAQFNRHGGVQLIIADPALADLPIVASFRSDNVEGFLRLLVRTSGVVVTRGPDGIVLHAGK